MEDHYTVLGLDRDASDRRIRKAYRELARQYHPDRNPSSEAAETFKRIVEAYEVLRDSVKRLEYDAALQKVGSGAVVDRFEDLFSVFSEREKDRPRRGKNIVTEVMIDIGDILTGTEAHATVSRRIACSDCNGTGAEQGVAYHMCTSCRGWGEVTFRSATGSGISTRSEPCTKCNGTGKIIDDPCGACGGDGMTELEMAEPVQVPIGVEPDEVITVKGRGHGGLFGGEPGDLLVVVRVRDQPEFERDGLDLITDAHVSFAQAALGSDTVVSGLDGPLSLEIPAGTQVGQELLLNGKGFPDRAGNRGDLRVRIMVNVPQQLDPRQREALVQLAEQLGENTSQYRLRRQKRFFR